MADGRVFTGMHVNAGLRQLVDPWGSPSLVPVIGEGHWVYGVKTDAQTRTTLVGISIRGGESKTWLYLMVGGAWTTYDAREEDGLYGAEANWINERNFAVITRP
jgi:hypothetical protein